MTYIFLQFLVEQFPVHFKRITMKHLPVPHFYCSNSVHSFKIYETAYRLCFENPTPSNLQKLEAKIVSLQQSIEADRVCFINGSNTATLQDCQLVLNSLCNSPYPTPIVLHFIFYLSNFQIANTFNSCFSSNFNEKRYEASPLVLTRRVFSIEDFQASITATKIQGLISSTKTARHKSFDGFPKQLLSNCPALFMSLFFIIFNSILPTLQFPFEWKTAFVNPFQKENKSNCLDS